MAEPRPLLPKEPVPSFPAFTICFPKNDLHVYYYYYYYYYFVLQKAA